MLIDRFRQAKINFVKLDRKFFFCMSLCCGIFRSTSLLQIMADFQGDGQADESAGAVLMGLNTPGVRI